jgi:peroxiredoxin Q/BCP
MRAAQDEQDGTSNRGGTVPQFAPGQTAPDFTLPAADGSTVSLSDYQGHKVVVYFYPAAMTPGCTKQACDFRDNLASLQTAGYAVLGVSPDTPAKLSRFVERDALTFPLLSDPGHEVLQAWGAWGEKTRYPFDEPVRSMNSASLGPSGRNRGSGSRST